MRRDVANEAFINPTTRRNKLGTVRWKRPAFVSLAGNVNVRSRTMVSAHHSPSRKRNPATSASGKATLDDVVLLA